MFGSSTTLLNADHYDVYFKGMPTWNGKVSCHLLKLVFDHVFAFDISCLCRSSGDMEMNSSIQPEDIIRRTVVQMTL